MGYECEEGRSCVEKASGVGETRNSEIHLGSELISPHLGKLKMAQ
jgi:hypothetical protein